VLTDDELGYDFSQIHAKGKCLIFESCLSGGLVDRQGSDFERDITDPGTCDVNGNNTIVIMSTLPSTLGRATYTRQSPLLYAIATAVQGGGKYDANNDGFLSAEEIFRIARPMELAQSAVLWTAYLMGTCLYSNSPIPLLSAAWKLLWFYVDIQILVFLRDHHFLLNWPHMQDDYPGELPLIQL